MKTYAYLLTAAFFVLVSSISCSEEPKALVPTESPSTGTPTTPTDSSGVPLGSPVYLKVGTKWESGVDLPAKQWKLCYISPTTPAQNIDCEVAIPEAQLYRSAVEFRIGTLNSASCPILSFRPYYYKRTDEARTLQPVGPPDDDGNPTQIPVGGYVPPSADSDSEPINCAPGTLQKECYGGAGPVMIETFPKSTSRYFLTDVMSEFTYSIDAENQLRTYGARNVNYLVTNSLDPALRTQAVATGQLNERVADSYYDYQIECKSYWGERLYGIKLIISDENWDSSGGGDDYVDWY
ncbi:hypothetical protein ACES2J_03350 [Bdellovibrio bacteriovorus]|uniref:hypothetical protein n=1 Tax=Bdellovibrio bacteriovorus TaxID=959 RepID=UPI0035A61A90